MKTENFTALELAMAILYAVHPPAYAAAAEHFERLGPERLELGELREQLRRFQ